jgi:REP element-mobilizing transposase RayT
MGTLRQRKNLRLQEYNYSNAGAYFVTACTQHRACLFGDVIHNQLQLLPAGKMIAHYWQELPDKYPCFVLDDFVVMPNHFHAIIMIDSSTLQAVSLSEGIQWFKTMTTNAYIQGVHGLGWTPFEGKLWQRSFYDHIIRDEQELFIITDYITQNPAKWIDDSLHPSKTLKK